jgi:Alpha/beta-hydrolase family N-terminus
MTSASPTTTDEIPLPRVFTRRISRPGLITGVLFFVVSLLPSMLPRSSITQGVVCGIACMIGYALGAAWQWAPDLRGRMADGDPGHDRSRRADPHRGPLPAEVVPPHYPMAGTASSAAAGPASRRGRLGAAPVGVWSGILVNGFFAGANQIFAPRDTATDQGVIQTGVGEQVRQPGVSCFLGEPGSERSHLRRHRAHRRGAQRLPRRGRC